MTTSREAHHSSATAEWYTPARYVDAARAVMGGIDLDPASSAEANKTVGATSYFNADDDGLHRPWWGRAWLNPPYGKRGGKSSQALWSDRLSVQYEQAQGGITQAVLLVNAATACKWFQPLWQHPVCLTDHRIRFIAPDGVTKNQPTHGNAFVYFGPQERWSLFGLRFRPFGRIVWPD